MIFWQTFLTSLKLPQKKATFSLNRVSMDIVIVFLFILLFIVSIPAFIEQIKNAHLMNVHVELFFLVIYFFIFYYLPLTIIVFGFISLVAYIGKWLTKFMQRKLHYSILWKMVAFSLTLPFLLYTIIALFVSLSDKFLWLGFIYAIIILVNIIAIYPKRKKQTTV